MNKKLLPPSLEAKERALATISVDGKDAQDLIHQWYSHAVKSQMIAARLERKVIEQEKAFWRDRCSAAEIKEDM